MCPFFKANCKYIGVRLLKKSQKGAVFKVHGKQKKKKTIGVMTQSRGLMAPPVRADRTKKGKGSYNRRLEKRVEDY